MKKALTLEHLKRNPEKLSRFGNVRIWSGEHHAWWRPDGYGYTKDVEQAGTFSANEAWSLCKHCGPEKGIRLEAA